MTISIVCELSARVLRVDFFAERVRLQLAGDSPVAITWSDWQKLVRAAQQVTPTE